MHILRVWIYAVIMLFSFTLGGYVSMPVIFAIAHTMDNDMSLSASATSTSNVIRFGAVYWYPILDLIVIIWAILMSTKWSTESEYYG